METNWEKLRKEKGIDYSEIRNKFYWYSEETIRRWFSGQQKPRYNNIGSTSEENILKYIERQKTCQI